MEFKSRGKGLVAAVQKPLILMVHCNLGVWRPCSQKKKTSLGLNYVYTFPATVDFGAVEPLQHQNTTGWKPKTKKSL